MKITMGSGLIPTGSRSPRSSDVVTDYGWQMFVGGIWLVGLILFSVEQAVAYGPWILVLGAASLWGLFHQYHALFVRLADEREANSEVLKWKVDHLRADNARMRAALLVISEAQVGGGSLRTAAHDVALLGADAELLRSRFS